MTALVPELKRRLVAPLPRYFDPTEFGLGLLLPVVGGHAGAGASGVALAFADASAAAGLRTLLIDGADPARSGLTNAWTSQLRSDASRGPGVAVGTAARAGMLGRHLRSVGRPVPRLEYPGIWEWCHADFLRDHGPFEVTVVDVGWDAWTGFDEVRFGPLAWVGASADASHPLLVADATVPSLRLTAGVHARWSAALAAGEVQAPPSLVLARTVAASADLRMAIPPSVAVLLDGAICFPPIASAETGGWTEQPLPSTAASVAGRLLGSLLPALSARFPVPRSHPRRVRRTSKET